MQFKGMNLCDFCFEPVAEGAACTNCGLTKDTYNAEVGLLQPGTILMGKYIIGRVLGRGGFGATYLAYSSERDEVVAIKEYYPTGIATRAKGEEKITIISNEKREVFEKGANRLFEEAKMMSRFNSDKNIVSVYEFFHANDTVYYSMEYLKGIDLKGYIKKKGGKLSEAEAVKIMRGVSEALVDVHSMQTLHRDISPDNIFVCTNGDVKLIDFGAAKQLIGDSRQVYSVVVKQGFAPVEQYNSTGEQGVWTDIYAVGASIYYSLTGKIPPDAMYRVENPEIPFDSSLKLSQEFMNIIKKCLNIKIEDRYQSAIELLGALNNLNVGDTVVGGSEYVQNVYNGVSSGLQGDNVSFDRSMDFQQKDGYNPYNSVNGGQIPPPSYNQPPNYSQYPPNYSQYPPSQYSHYHVEKYGEDKEKSGILKGLLIGVGALIIVVLLIFIIKSFMGPGGFGPGPDPFGPPPMR